MSGLTNAGLFFVATSIVLLIAIFVFDLVTRYKVWEEINKGNTAVALSLGGIVLGVSNVMKSAIESNDKLVDTIMWGGIGTAVLLIVYFAFEILTPKLNVSEEIGKGNKAVGLISLVFSIAFSFIIGASIA
jgi:putative membrane protein